MGREQKTSFSMHVPQLCFIQQVSQTEVSLLTVERNNELLQLKQTFLGLLTNTMGCYLRDSPRSYGHIGINCSKRSKIHLWKQCKFQKGRIMYSSYKSSVFYCTVTKKRKILESCESWMSWYIVSRVAGKQREHFSILAVIVRQCPSHSVKEVLSGS